MVSEDYFRDEIVKQCNQYGDLIKYYVSETGWIRYNNIFDREYSEDAYPIKTVFNNGDDWTHRYEDTYTAWLGKPLGIKEVQAFDYSVYPNPASDYLIISGATKGNIVVTNAEGRIIYTKLKVADTENIDISQWGKGIYFILLQTENNRLVNKVIKK